MQQSSGKCMYFHFLLEMACVRAAQRKGGKPFCLEDETLLAHIVALHQSEREREKEMDEGDAIGLPFSVIAGGVGVVVGAMPYNKNK